MPITKYDIWKPQQIDDKIKSRSISNALYPSQGIKYTGQKDNIELYQNGLDFKYKSIFFTQNISLDSLLK